MNRCRLCYSDTNPELSVNIFNKKHDPPISKLIADLTQLIIINDDPYTKIVCQLCFEQLKKCDIFRKMILLTDWRMRHDHQIVDNLNEPCRNYTTITTNTDGYIKEETIEIEEYPINDNSWDEPINCADLGAKTSTNTIYISEISHETICTDDEDRPGRSSNLGSKNKTNNGGVTLMENALPNIPENRVILKEEPVEMVEHLEIVAATNNYYNIRTRRRSTRGINAGDRLLDNNENKSGEIEEDPLKIDFDNLNKNRRNAIEKSKSGRYRCVVCYKWFVSRCLLRIHFRVHTGEKPYRCAVCGAQFSQEGNRLRHSRLHRLQKEYTCDKCNKQFAVKQDLQKHMQKHLRTHTQPRLYGCGMCGKFFAKSSVRNRHLKIHSRQKSYDYRQDDDLQIPENMVLTETAIEEDPLKIGKDIEPAAGWS